MGFPMWTLVGMGVTAVLAMLMTGLAYLAQSPRALLRLGLGGYRLDLRVKLFTGYALASLILMLGFFLAGVPIDDGTRTTAVATVSNDPIAAESGAMSEPATDSSAGSEQAVPSNSDLSSTDSVDEATTQTPSSGAFGGPPAGSTDEIATEVIPPTATPEQAGPSVTPDSDNPATATSADAEQAVPTDSTIAASGTATATPSPTATATPPPTATPSPTITPTPIEGETGVITTNGSTLWVRRSPGGQQLVLVQDNEVVLLENGRANQGGILWREIRTTNGILGWIQTEFLEAE